MFWNDIMNSVWIGGRGDGGLHERTPYVYYMHVYLDVYCDCFENFAYYHVVAVTG